MSSLLFDSTRDQVDMVFEMRDARVPFCSSNADLDKMLGPKKARLIILNKVCLISRRRSEWLA